MNRKYPFLLLLLVLALTSCARLDATSYSPFKSDSVVLEIITDARGMVYPKEGDLLTMRLYESGRFEYDDFPEQHPPDAVAGKVTITRKEAKLNPADVKELIGLAQQPDFLSAKDSYSSEHSHVDDTWITKVNFSHQGQNKRITLINLWDLQGYEKDRLKYPPSMIRLLERAMEVKSKALENISSIKS